MNRHLIPALIGAVLIIIAFALLDAPPVPGVLLAAVSLGLAKALDQHHA